MQSRNAVNVVCDVCRTYFPKKRNCYVYYRFVMCDEMKGRQAKWESRSKIKFNRHGNQASTRVVRMLVKTKCLEN